MKKQFTDTHIQVETGNDLFEDGRARQVFRREFEDRGVVWFKKPLVMGEGNEPITDRTLAERLERKFAEEFNESGRQIIDPSNF